MILSAALMSCATTEKVPTNKAEKPPRPRISQKYQDLLMAGPPELVQEAQKHEWDWHGYADRMEMRAGYR
jgi:hypothetical protein